MNTAIEKTPAKRRGKIKFERSYPATLDEVWELWTTKEGIEAWWGPDGFTTQVLELQLKPGGKLRYAMTATGKDQVAFMKQAKLPLTTESKGRFDELEPKTRLVLTQLMDFVPGVAPYEIAARLTLKASKGTVKMNLVIDAAHDAQWTRNATLGWESQLERLGKLLASRR